MAKQRSKKRTPQKRSKKTTPTKILEEIVSRPPTTSEQTLDAAVDHCEAALAALDADDIRSAARAIQASVDANPHDITSLTLYAELATEGAAERLAALRIVERVARNELGETALTEDRGHFWGVVETPPYMRLKNEIADTLQACGDAPSAIVEYEEMLSLNPNDNQGVRDPLLGLYLGQGELARADALMREYEEDTAMMRWGRLLWHLLNGETGEPAEEALTQARTTNAFVAPLLLGALEPPEQMPTTYSPGGENEAVIAVGCLATGWGKQPDSTPLEWLAQRVLL